MWVGTYPEYLDNIKLTCNLMRVSIYNIKSVHSPQNNPQQASLDGFASTIVIPKHGFKKKIWELSSIFIFLKNSLFKMRILLEWVFFFSFSFYFPFDDTLNLLLERRCFFLFFNNNIFLIKIPHIFLKNKNKVQC